MEKIINALIWLVSIALICLLVFCFVNFLYNKSSQTQKSFSIERWEKDNRERCKLLGINGPTKKVDHSIPYNQSDINQQEYCKYWSNWEIEKANERSNEWRINNEYNKILDQEIRQFKKEVVERGYLWNK